VAAEKIADPLDRTLQIRTPTCLSKVRQCRLQPVQVAADDQQADESDP
jgi:hypothetical protein